MTKPKARRRRTRRSPSSPGSGTTRIPGKLAVGSAVGAACGALFGIALVRNPNFFNEMVEQFSGILTNPGFLSAIQGMTATPSWSSDATGPASAPAVQVHPPGGCGVEGCPTNNPHAFAEEEARVSQENPTWTHAQVQVEATRRLEDQSERAHLAAEPPRRKSRAKKNSEPEETSN
jgi:hypothetical protein